MKNIENLDGDQNSLYNQIPSPERMKDQHDVCAVQFIFRVGWLCLHVEKVTTILKFYKLGRKFNTISIKSM